VTPLLDLVTALFAVSIVLPCVYLAFLSAVTLRARPAVPPAVAHGTVRFALLVPAHNEELVIGRNVAGLMRLRYPRDRFSVHVVADNCDDGTAAVARDQGACVHERRDVRRRGKGAALNWLALEVAREVPDAEAFVVVDADSELSADSLSVMADHLRSGAVAVQALHLVAVSEDRPLVRMRELAFRLTCHLRPLAYTTLGGSSGLYGTGMCFAAPLYRRYRWSESSVVEDGELFLRLVRDGHRVALAADATVRQAVPATFRRARTQAIRWERGRFDHVVDAMSLVWNGVRRRDPNRLLVGVAFFIPPVAVLAAASALAIVLGATTGTATLLLVAIAALLSLLLYVLRGAGLAKMTPRATLQILLWAPVFAAWKLWIVALAAVGVGRGEWIRTARVAQP
jgi:cellulose synthase/poly-beta-1,6-N-acetylglucosamine synthase-like glycosyltransferase